MSKERTQIDRFLTNTHLGEGKALKVKTVYNTWANPPATGAEVLGFERVYDTKVPLGATQTRSPGLYVQCQFYTGPRERMCAWSISPDVLLRQEGVNSYTPSRCDNLYSSNTRFTITPSCRSTKKWGVSESWNAEKILNPEWGSHRLEAPRKGPVFLSETLPSHQGSSALDESRNSRPNRHPFPVSETGLRNQSTSKSRAVRTTNRPLAWRDTERWTFSTEGKS